METAASPLLLGVLIFVVMTTWHRGIEVVRRSTAQKPESIDAFLANLKSGKIARVPGTGSSLAEATWRFRRCWFATSLRSRRYNRPSSV